MGVPPSLLLPPPLPPAHDHYELLIQTCLSLSIQTQGDHRKCKLANDLAVVLDASASVKKEGFDLAKTFAKKLVSRFAVSPKATRVSLMAFSHYLRIPVKFRDLLSEEQVKAELDRLQYEASFSATGSALVALTNEMFSKEAGARVDTPGESRVKFLYERLRC